MDIICLDLHKARQSAGDGVLGLMLSDASSISPATGQVLGASVIIALLPAASAQLIFWSSATAPSSAPRRGYPSGCDCLPALRPRHSCGFPT